MLSSEVQGKVVEAFEVFDHENNKTVDVREVSLGFYTKLANPQQESLRKCVKGGHHSQVPWSLPQRKSASRSKIHITRQL